MPETASIVFRGARVIDPAGRRDGVSDVLIAGATIAEMGDGLEAQGAEAIDCAGFSGRFTLT